MNKKAINYFLIAHALRISIALVLAPGILTIIMSFTDWNGISPNINFIGTQNFKELFADQVFWRSIFNNVKWTVLFLNRS